jgi:hypothetical protein
MDMRGAAWVLVVLSITASVFDGTAGSPACALRVRTQARRHVRESRPLGVATSVAAARATLVWAPRAVGDHEQQRHEHEVHHHR